MIFTEIHDQQRRIIRPILESLFDLALKNQTRPQDLFLLTNLGYYSKKLENNEIGLCKYMLGLPGGGGGRRAWNTWRHMISLMNIEKRI